MRGLLGSAGHEDFEADALLLTSEIVTNATGVGGGCVLSAWYLPDDGSLRVEVHDHSSHVPAVPSRRASSQLSGRGLRIVDALASRWGIDRDADGKSVWFEMYRGQRPSALT